jgi:biotin carboxyl carrier protein
MRRYQVTVGGTVHVVDVQELGAHDFRVTVQGQELDVTLSDAEEVSETVISPEIAPSRTAGPGAPVSAAAFRPARPETLPPLVPSAPPALPPAPTAGNGAVRAPMPGTITAVEVKAGEAVRAGQALVKLEAMKMVNAIKAPHAGRVTSVHVQPGENVTYGHVLVVIGEV